MFRFCRFSDQSNDISSKEKIQFCYMPSRLYCGKVGGNIIRGKDCHLLIKFFIFIQIPIPPLERSVKVKKNGMESPWGVCMVLQTIRSSDSNKHMMNCIRWPPRSRFHEEGERLVKTARCPLCSISEPNLETDQKEGKNEWHVWFSFNTLTCFPGSHFNNLSQSKGVAFRTVIFSKQFSCVGVGV